MRIGDIEYTRTGFIQITDAGESEIQDLGFALGIKIRPLLTRVSASLLSAQAVTGSQTAFLENGQAIPDTQTRAALIADRRLHIVAEKDFALATNGMGMIDGPTETLWWKILLPDVRVHFVTSVLATAQLSFTLHYRFAELTDDEIVEIAAQRAQG